MVNIIKVVFETKLLCKALMVVSTGCQYWVMKGDTCGNSVTLVTF